MYNFYKIQLCFFYSKNNVKIFRNSTDYHAKHFKLLTIIFLLLNIKKKLKRFDQFSILEISTISCL